MKPWYDGSDRISGPVGIWLHLVFIRYLLKSASRFEKAQFSRTLHMDILTYINPSTLPLYTPEQQRPISISPLPLSVYSVPLLLHRVHLLIRLGHYISGCWPNQCNKGSLRALLPISIIRLRLKRGLCGVCLITAARRRWASISQVGLLICLLPYESCWLVGVCGHTGAKRDPVPLHNDFISSAAFWFRKVRLGKQWEYYIWKCGTFFFIAKKTNV